LHVLEIIITGTAAFGMNVVYVVKLIEKQGGQRANNLFFNIFKVKKIQIKKRSIFFERQGR